MEPEYELLNEESNDGIFAVLQFKLTCIVMLCVIRAIGFCLTTALSDFCMDVFFHDISHAVYHWL